MKKRFLFFFLLPLALSCLRASNVLAEESPAGQADQGDAQQASALMKNAQAFVEAFEKGDAKAVAAFWAEDGDYVDLSGRRLQGRPAIEDALKDETRTLTNTSLNLCQGLVVKVRSGLATIILA